LSDTLGKLVGVPYTEGGRTIEGGVDCYGLLRLALAELGLEIPESYAEAVLGVPAVEIPAGEARRGDLVVMEADGSSGFGLHVGMMVDRLRFIHATRASGSRLDFLELWMRAGKVQRLARIASEVKQ
jgi:cell wall-associated NlpC family hydrolase